MSVWNGTQILWTDVSNKKKILLEKMKQELDRKGLGSITTEISERTQFYYAEDYHQQYLKKVPKGYCGLRGTGVSCPLDGGAEEDHEEL